jgi:RND family efflux transporter MFP subunit
MLSPSAAKAIGVQHGKVELSDVRRTVQAVGSIELPWSQQAYVSTMIAGRVEQVLVKPGETVAAGQELARISGSELENLQLEMLQAATDKALAIRLLKSHQSAGDGIARKELLQAETEAQQQSARFNAAWQKLAAIGLSRETLQRICDTRKTVPAVPLLSPIRGVVAEANARAGQIVQPTESLYHLVDSSRVWIVGNVLEADVGKVKAGLPVEITLAMLPGENLKAKIDHIELRLNPDRTLSVKALLPNSGNLKSGMFGRLQIQLASSKAIVCPLEALIRDGQTSEALVQQSPGNYVRKPVVIAAVRGQFAEIEEGLFPGDKVVTVGSHELAALFPRTVVSPGTTASAPTGIAAQGIVELPIDQKSFASAPIAGQVKHILVEHGQRVKKGEVLAELESLPFKTLQLDFLQARSRLAQARINLQHAEALGGDLARKTFWELQSQRDSYQQEVASLRRQLKLLGLADEAIAAIEESDLAASPKDLPAVLPIRAPASGLIGDFELIPGQFVAQETQLFELHNPLKVWVRAFAFEQDAVNIKVGQSVQVRLASDASFRAVGKVDRVDPILVGDNRALSIWTELDNPGLQLKEGMAATVMIETALAGK